MTTHSLGASKHYRNHARHEVTNAHTLDSALHVSRYKWLLAQHITTSARVLDIGCGTGYGTALIAQCASTTVAIDLPTDSPDLTTQVPGVRVHEDDATAPDLRTRLGEAAFDIVVSFEVIEHLEDYHTFLLNCIDLMNSSGSLILSTPNRRMTYERYERRRLMDDSHIQEFTPISFTQLLLRYFSSVDLYYQLVPNYWPPHGSAATVHRTTTRRGSEQSRLKVIAKNWLPPATQRWLARRLTLSHGLAGITTPSRSYDAATVEFASLSTEDPRTYDAFSLVAVARTPRITGISP